MFILNLKVSAFNKFLCSFLLKTALFCYIVYKRSLTHRGLEEVFKLKNSIRNVEHRRNTIIDIVASRNDNRIEVNELATIMKISTMTIRRDLDVLEQMGKVIRYHGYATLNNKQPNEGDTKNVSLERIKKEIARTAASYVSEHNTMFINSSSTALSTVDFLEDKPVTIVTNNLRINRKNVHPSTSIMLPGGELRFPKEALVGDLCVTNLSNVHSDITIIGCSGISVDKGLSTINIHESKVNQVMINNTNGPVIVVCDYRKVGVDSSFFVCDISKVTLLITDIYTPPDIIKEFEDKGVMVIQIAP